MGWVTNLNASLNLNIQNFTKNMMKASTVVNGFATNINGYINGGIVKPAEKAKMDFKDVARIVQGIIISKVFYGGLNAIRKTTDEVWEFTKSLEYAKLAYSNLFGNVKLAMNFINVLQDFAAKTPFSFAESESAARRLLAYGIQYKNVMYMMKGVLAASTMTGNPQTVESVSRALGQIYTKGRLMNEEMRQLAEAGIPAYEILRQKLGLTQKQLQNLGRQSIPAATAINALIDGITERFGNVADAAVQTITGMLSNIKDNFLMLSTDILSPVTSKLRNFIKVISDAMFVARELFSTGGTGAVFEHFVPAALQESLRSLIANFILVKNAITMLVTSLLSLVGQILPYLIHWLTMLMPILVSIIDIAVNLIRIISENNDIVRILAAVLVGAATAWLVFKAAALANMVLVGLVNIIMAVAKAVAFLSMMLATSPMTAFVLVAAVVIGVLVAMAVQANDTTSSFARLFQMLSALTGVKTNILLPETKKRTSDLDKFNEKLAGTSKGLNGVAGAAKKATKELMSFDEVFNLAGPDSGTGSGGLDTGSITNLLDNINPINIEDILPTMEDVTKAIDDFWQQFGKTFGERLTAAGIGAGIGAIIGGIIGGALGNPVLGAQIGAVAGAIVGLFWEDIKVALGISDTAGISIGIGGALGAAIGAIIGGPGGALIGTAIGLLVGGLVGIIIDGFTNADPMPISLGIGTLLGAAIGAIAGGPVGAAIGAAAGALVGWIVGLLIENWSDVTNWLDQAWTDISTFLDKYNGWGTAGGLLLGPLGGMVGSFIDMKNKWPEVSAWFTTAAADVSKFFSDVGTDVAIGFDNVTTDVADFFTGIGEDIGEFFKPLVDTVSTVLTDVGEGINTVCTDVATAVSTVWGEVSKTLQNIWDLVSGIFLKVTGWIGEKLKEAYDKVNEKFTEIKDKVTEKVIEVWNKVSEWFGKIKDTVTEKVTGVTTTIKDKFTDIKNKVTEKVTGVWNTVSEWFGKVKNTITEKVNGVVDTVKEKFTNIKNTITEKVTSIWNSISEWFIKIYNTAIEKVSGIYTDVVKWFQDLRTKVPEKISEMYESVKKGVGDIYGTFKGWIKDMWDNVFGKLFGWINTAIDKLEELFGLNSKTGSINVSGSPSTSGMYGNARGGICNRQHAAMIAEGGRPELISPLSGELMRPFTDAIASGVVQGMLPIFETVGGDSGMPPVYVGTLIADEGGLRELEKRMRIVRVKEDFRRGKQST